MHPEAGQEVEGGRGHAEHGKDHQVERQPRVRALAELAPCQDLGSDICGGVREACSTNLSHIMYQLDGFRKSSPPQNRQLVVLISKNKQQVDDLVGELTCGCEPEMQRQ